MESIELKKILILSTHHNVKTYINHKTVNAVYTIFCKGYDK